MNTLTEIGLTAAMIAQVAGIIGAVTVDDTPDRRFRSWFWTAGVAATFVALLTLMFGGFWGALDGRSAALRHLTVSCFWLAGVHAAAAMLLFGLRQLGYRRDLLVAHSAWVRPMMVTLLVLAGCWLGWGFAAGPHHIASVTVPGT